MKKVLISAFSCQPGKGSEPGVGWNWVIQAAKCSDVYVLTRTKMKPYIEEASIPEEVQKTLHFIYCDSSYKLRGFTIYLEYIHWQYKAYRFAKKLCKEIRFDYIWQLTWGNMFLPVPIYKLPVPFIWGPVGGAEQVPKEFWNEFPFKNRVVHQLKYLMGKYMRIIPWVIGPAKKAEKIIARTSATKELFPKALRDKVCVHLEACVFDDRDFFYPEGTPSILKKCQGVNLIYTGRICDIKNTPALVETMKLVKSKGINARLHVIGSGDMQDALQAQIVSHGLNEDIIVYGNVERKILLKAVSESDIFVFPSLREGASWSLLEAMHFELPIVAFDVNGMHETLSNDCAFLVNLMGKEPAQANCDFAYKVYDVILMPENCKKKYGINGKRRIREYHSAEGVKSFIQGLLT